jgi:hypothetical protein
MVTSSCRGFYGIMLPDADKDDALDLVKWAAIRSNVTRPCDLPTTKRGR